ncbi:MAG: amidohydrolase [Acidobacteriota bacterium]|nr:amidohydrolase [Acidobacteriota bacterium]
MKADAVYRNASFLTLDPVRPRVDAVAVRGDEIIAAGTESAILALAGSRTRRVDLEGGFVLPGFIDSHVHLLNGGLALLSVHLRDAATRAEFAARLAAAAAARPKGEWILNGDWDHQLFRPVELPRREWIDAATPDHPVCVNRLDEHMVLCNSLALARARIDRTTLSPPGGEIVRDPATGEPTGILKDAAMDLVARIVPAPSTAERRRALDAALRCAAERGVTSVHDVSGEAGLDLYREYRRAGRLTVRISFYMPISRIDEVLRMGLWTGFGDDVLRFAGVKGFADGSLGSGTAAFFESYSDEPGNRGLFHGEMFPEGIMARRITAADAGHLQVAVHAIGDRAIDAILSHFEEAAAKGPARDRRFRIEHAQHVRPADFDRFARLGVIASVQPYHAVDDGRWAEGRIGPARARTTYAFRTFLDRGIPLAFGSDWPVAPMDPIQGLAAAVTRAPIDGSRAGGWVPEQKIRPEEAVRAYTLGGAYAEFAEGRKGVLKAGRLADMVVLDKDPFAVKPGAIGSIRVLRTICGGAEVFRR